MAARKPDHLDPGQGRRRGAQTLCRSRRVGRGRGRGLRRLQPSLDVVQPAERRRLGPCSKRDWREASLRGLAARLAEGVQALLRSLVGAFGLARAWEEQPRTVTSLRALWV